MNRYEEELQKNLEAGKTPQGDDLDIRAYQQVFQALTKMPETKLSRNFSDRIVTKVLEKRKRDASRDMFWLSGGIFFLAVAFAVAVVITGFKLEWGFLKQISGYAGVFIFGAVFIGLLSWLDKRLVSNQPE